MLLTPLIEQGEGALAMRTIGGGLAGALVGQQVQRRRPVDTRLGERRREEQSDLGEAQPFEGRR